MVCAGATRPSQRFLRGAVALLVAFASLVAGPRSLHAQSGEVVVKSPQAILMDADSGGILFQRNADELVPPASMSKLMLLIMIFNALRAGEITLETEVMMSEYAWRTGGAPSRTSAMFVPLGKTAKVDEMLKGIIVQSGNDASIAMAERLGGSEQKFAEAMTEQARRLGLKKSVFRNATGLYHPEHLSTMRELAILARMIIKDYPEYYPIFAQREFNYRQHKFFNRNPLLGAVPGVDGLKTGYVKEFGLRHGSFRQSGQSPVDHGHRRCGFTGRAQGRWPSTARVGLQELLGGPAVRTGRDRGVCANLGG